ncbi:MAG TPA: glycine C-acetyltransferase [Planctomycetaceae bacterium]|nr:glycine C-acetyltransferase [Planctomycetaceae bacterium]HCK55215.1 glycine C-acetyltransferase [Planctomycetaceae bacterium]
MVNSIREHLVGEIAGIREQGLYKSERVLESPQRARIEVADGEVLNFCANNYLGLSDHPDVIAAAREALDRWGFGLSSVRFICGTQGVHKQLEERLSEFLQTDDTILYSSCFDANGGLFETLLDAEDAVISDSLNHASIIDGVRLCKAQRHVYQNNDMADLETKLQATAGARHRLIATDGVFSMDGFIANLGEICDLADRYDAMVMVDDSHAVGVIGGGGRGSIEYRDVLGRIDIVTGTLGKALGGASGGYTSGRSEIIEMLRQRSRPYLFSNSLAPMIAAAALKALELLSGSSTLLDRLHENASRFRDGMESNGFEVPPGEHPIVPIMLGDATLAQSMAERLLARGIYVIGFSFPVVPRGAARIRVQLSAAHSPADVDYAIEQFVAVRDELSAA